MLDSNIIDFLIRQLANERTGRSTDMRVLITGASGFVAATLIRRLLGKGYEVHCIVRKDSELWRIAAVRHRLVLHQVELTQSREVDAVFAAVRPHWFFHLSTVRTQVQDFESFFQGNVVVAGNLISACLRFPPDRVVVYGSSLEYGHRDQPLREDLVATPHTLHGATKLCATHLFLQACHSFDLPVVVLRPFLVYGPWESGSRLLSKAILAGMEGRSIQLTSPGVRRDYLFIDDLIDASLIALSKEEAIGEIINIGSGTQVSNEALVAEINKLTGFNLRISSDDYPRRETDTEYWVADPRKCQALLGWSPSTSLVAGLQLTMEWLTEHRHLDEYK